MLWFAMQPQESLHKVSKHPSGARDLSKSRRDEACLWLRGAGNPRTHTAPFVLLLEKDRSQNNAMQIKSSYTSHSFCQQERQ